ncbi:hypothetical protein NOSIN_02825 [Nocardiopsis sinuspersici]|uniref:Uncharacterized protein n=1 Tax=Nocardiopsis sinuspersici TaxID=501010 RepID=A0A1V3BW77_9ACTN|nr:hypothetical protein NOSIN_02825 [Nocardiopsis sinuspersici]
MSPTQNPPVEQRHACCRHGAVIGYVILDVAEPSSWTHMYLAVSGPESHSRYADWFEEGYPSFSRSFPIETHPIDEFGAVGPKGYHLVFDAPRAKPVENGRMVIDTLREMAREGCAVVVATHNDNVRDACDAVFDVQDQRLTAAV